MRSDLLFNWKFDEQFLDSLYKGIANAKIGRTVLNDPRLLIKNFYFGDAAICYKEIESGLLLYLCRGVFRNTAEMDRMTWLREEKEEHFLFFFEIADKRSHFFYDKANLFEENFFTKFVYCFSSKYILSILPHPNLHKGGMLVIQISRKLLLDFFEDVVTTDAIVRQIRSGSFEANCTSYNNAIFERLSEIFSLDFESRGNFLKSKSLVYQLLEQTFLKMEKNDNLLFSIGSTSDLEQVLIARNKLINFLDSPPKIPDIANELGMSARKFETLFKSTFGTSYYNYYLGLRMARAKALLENRLPVVEVAKLVGYKNFGNFTRMFYRFYGTLPKSIGREL